MESVRLGFNKRVARFFRDGLCFLVVIFIGRVFAEREVSQTLLLDIQKSYGEAALQRVVEWQTLMKTAKHLSEPEKLKQVNDFFNQHLNFVDDRQLWGQSDYWATPVEFLAKGAGDCEDYSIAKYFTLIELGVPDEKMRITYVKALALNQAHMVLTYYASPREVPVVLDNLVTDIQLATQRHDLQPVYSFNGAGLWKAKVGGLGQRVGDPGRLNRWGELNQRMRGD